MGATPALGQGAAAVCRGAGRWGCGRDSRHKAGLPGDGHFGHSVARVRVGLGAACRNCA
jgi:hypothetical protein